MRPCRKEVDVEDSAPEAPDGPSHAESVRASVPEVAYDSAPESFSSCRTRNFLLDREVGDGDRAVGDRGVDGVRGESELGPLTMTQVKPLISLSFRDTSRVKDDTFFSRAAFSVVCVSITWRRWLTNSS